MIARAYLRRIMLARLLAAFALITGLAAVGTPAEARMLSAVSQQVDGGAQSQQGSNQATCPAVAPRAVPGGKVAQQSACRPRKPVVIFIPTIQFGPDRALE